MDKEPKTSRMDKLQSKKDRTDGPYSAKHIRRMENLLELRTQTRASDKATTATTSMADKTATDKLSKGKKKSK